MAESIVNFVLSKLADVVVKEVLLLYNVHKQVETVSCELGLIQAFLKDVDMKQITDERQKHWVKEVRDIAYSIEDVIDTFLSEVPQKSYKSVGMIEAMKMMIKKTKKLPAVHKLVDEISQIQTRMIVIEASRVRYGINNLGEGSGEIKLSVRPPVLPDIDPDVVGFNEDRDQVAKELLDETIKRRVVVSICGVGGLGKTTLAQKVYNSNDVMRQFGLRIWIAISQKYELIDILKKIAEQLEPPIDPSKQPKQEETFLTKLHDSLRGQKYLIVLDDIWTDDLWTQIGAALPEENNESRVLVTTRFSNVAKNADPTCEPYEQGFLTKELSLELLLKKALPNQDPNKTIVDDLSDITDQFIHKCGGLPLALVVLGGLLSKKSHNYNTWSKVLQTMSWHDDGNKCSEIIGTSYEDLPFALKSCFMYFAAFPEDYNIIAEPLLRMWVAEGFIPQENNRTLEETAESFLEDLVQRSMVQVTSRSTDGSIEYCRLHDLLRNLAVRKAKEDNFLVVYSHPDDQQSLSRTRRVAVHHPDCDELVMNQNLRTLLCFGNKCMPNCSKQKLLKVVSTGDSMDTKIKLKMFERLTQLRYLNLTGKLSDGSEEGCLVKVIGAMKLLQTLDICRWNFEGVLPDCAWHIKTLRHVNTLFSGLPPSTKLTNLQTLTTVIIKDSWQTELPHLPNLRTLKLHHKSSSWGGVVAFLGTLKHLISLSITGSPIPIDIFNMIGFPFYRHLQSLILDAGVDQEIPIEMAIDVSMFPPHITSLIIYNYWFTQDVMPVLEKLLCLKMLLLFQACTNRKMRCSAKGFGQLEVLELMDFTLLEDWDIEEGAMPILRELKIISCNRLCVPRGLRYLTNLQTFTWWERDLGDKANEVRNYCKHVPSLSFDWC